MTDATRSVLHGVVRSRLKELVEWAVTTSAARRVLWAGRSGSVVLAYHNIVPDRSERGGSRGLHLVRAEFASHLDRLSRSHDIVPLARLLREGPGHRSERPQAAITFDDAYAGALTEGVAELRGRGLPATVFVAPALLGSDAFWWDAVVQEGEDDLPRARRRRALTVLQGRTDRVREWASEAGIPWTVPPRLARPADEELLRAALAGEGLDVAPHGWTHANLTCLSASEAVREIASSLDWLRERFQRVVPILAYPYGAWSAGTALAARQAGCVGGVRADGGTLHRRPADPFAVPRAAMGPGLSRRGLALRTGTAP